MPDAAVSAMRHKLLRLRADLEVATAASDESSQIVELDQARVGRLSRMDAMQAQQMAQAAGRRRELMVRNIAAALARIENGEYGLCQSCDEPINPKRLDFDPTAVLCIECASEAEA